MLWSGGSTGCRYLRRAGSSCSKVRYCSTCGSMCQTVPPAMRIFWVLFGSSACNTVVRGTAIASSCMRRNTDIPAATPLGLSGEFAQNATKRRQWSAFLRKNALNAPALENVVEELRDGLAEALMQA